MNYSKEVQEMCCIAKGPHHGPAPIPEEGRWVQAKEITDISAYTHGVGWCAPQQGACKLSLNVKNGNRVFPGYQSPRYQMKREILNKCLIFRDGGQ